VRISAVGIPVITDKIDIANARITFGSDSVANITASRISRDVVRKMRIFQRDAYISLDFHRRIIEVIRPRKDTNGLEGEAAGMDGFFVSQKSVLEEEEPLRKELLSFIDSVRNGTPPEATGEDGREALSLAIRILEEIDRTGIPS